MAGLSVPGSRGLSVKLGIPSATQVQDPVHYLGACGDNWAQFVAVDEFGCSGAVVACQAGDLLDGHAVGGHQGDEGVAQVSWRPVCAEPGRFGDLAELTADIRRVQRRADDRGEDEVVILPQGTGY